MKIIIAILTMFFVTSHTKNLDFKIVNIKNVSTKNAYPPFDKFIGKWTWQEGKTKFLLVLQKGNFDMRMGHTIEVLQGAYQLSKNGVDVVNTLSSISTNPSLLLTVMQNDPNRLDGSFNDPVSDRTGNVILVYEEGSPVKLRVEVKKTEMIIQKSTQKTEFTVPTKFVLQKVE